MTRRSFLIISFLASILYLKGQGETLDDIFKVDYDTPLTLEVQNLSDTIDQIVAPKKKKTKKNVFFGMKTRKAFVKSVFGRNVVFETFYVLKKPIEPLEYARDFYWLDYKTRKLKNSLRLPEGQKIGILHGPYKKMMGEQVLEQGWYFMGMKHRRWVKLNRHDILQDKKYWWRGWPQESKMAYWDFDKTQLKEVIPLHYGEREGEYWVFHKNGNVAVRGVFKHGKKIGLWREFYDNRRIKREVVYPKEPFDDEFVPYISREWDEKGTQVYDREKELKTRK